MLGFEVERYRPAPEVWSKYVRIQAKEGKGRFLSFHRSHVRQAALIVAWRGSVLRTLEVKRSVQFYLSWPLCMRLAETFPVLVGRGAVLARVPEESRSLVHGAHKKRLTDFPPTPTLCTLCVPRLGPRDTRKW